MPPIKKTQPETNQQQGPVLKPGDRFVDAFEAAEILGVSVNTMNFWRCAGRGPKYFKRTRQVRYLISDLVAWATTQPVEPQRRISA